MMNIKSYIVMYVVHSIWCIAFGVLGYVLYGMVSQVIFCAIFPTIMFYGLWFWYDASERYLFRKMKIVRVISP